MTDIKKYYPVCHINRQLTAGETEIHINEAL